jgi:hypothetical protein
MWAIISSLVVALAIVSQGTTVPDFSGRWTVDHAKSANLARDVNGNSTAAIFGESCVITQTTDALTLDIVAGGLKVQVVYRLDGKPSTNRSPGPPGQPDVTIVSTTQWNGPVLHITTKSESVIDGVTVPVESVRKMWLTADGDLAIERRGSPARIVSTAWSVYVAAPARAARKDSALIGFDR